MRSRHLAALLGLLLTSCGDGSPAGKAQATSPPEAAQPPAVKPPHHLPLPPMAEGTFALVLEGENPSTPLAGHGLYSEVVSSDGDQVKHWDSQLAILANGHRPTTTTLRYTLGDEVPAGVYTLGVSMRQGGTGLQRITVEAGKSPDAMDPRATYKMAVNSWEPPQWKLLDGSFHLFPDDRYVDITLSGAATDKKLLDGYLLTRKSPLPEGLSPQEIALRSRMEKAYAAAEPQTRLWIFEGDSARETSALYEALDRDGSLPGPVALHAVDRAQAMAAQRSLGLGRLPAVVWTNGGYVAQAIWEGEVNPEKAQAILAAMRDGRTGEIHAPTPGPVAVTALIDGIPQQWLVASLWTGRAGLNEWGLGYEPDIRPGVDHVIGTSRADRRLTNLWRQVATGPSGTVEIETLRYSSSWSRGTAYACLYLHSDTTQIVDLHFSQTGIRASVWLDGQSISTGPDREFSSPHTPTATHAETSQQVDTTDQGMQVIVSSTEGEGPRAARLSLHKGWNRLLIKLVTRQPKGETLALNARFTDADGKPASGLQTAISDPEPSLVSRQAISRLIPLVYNDAPANLPQAGDPLKLTVDLQSTDYLAWIAKNLQGFSDPRPYPGLEEALDQLLLPLFAVKGSLELTVTDYDGKEIATQSAPITLPGTTSFDLGPAPPRGYYATHIRFRDQAGNLVTAFPPDGFSVIGGTQSQAARKGEKKIASSYYFMRTPEIYEPIFTWLNRIGIYRNVGGHVQRNLDLYREAAARGIELTADLWNINNPEEVEGYVAETAPYVDSFKSFNEIDFHPDTRGSPEHWVGIAKLHYETVKQHAPEATVLGASLVIRRATDTWVEDCIKLGLAKYVDAWDIHAYPQEPPVLEGIMANSPNEGEQALRAILKDLRIADDKPLWIGETGAWAHHGSDGRRWQADTCAKMAAAAISRPEVEVIAFLVPWKYSRERAGMWTLDAGHMPSEAAYYTASALIDGFDYQRLEYGAGIQAGQFGPTTMLWTKGDARVVTLRREVNTPVVLVDVVGRVQGLPVAPDGSVQVRVSSSPAYVLAEEDYDRLTR